MTTFLKILAIVLIGLYFSACTTNQTRQETRIEWDVDMANKSEAEKFAEVEAYCKDFAFKAVVKGSRYQEADIYNTCVYRKGYKTRVVAVGNQ